VRGHDLIELDAGGTVLGPIPAARYEGGRERLQSGDLLLLYTPGYFLTNALDQVERAAAASSKARRTRLTG